MPNPLPLFDQLQETMEPVGLAVSGGPDSMAMAWLAKKYLGPNRIRAFIVEHGLRLESPEEAKTVQQNLKNMGIPASILRWEHGPVTSRIHVKARKARYDLLLTGCRAYNIDTLLIAHHRNDQAETILMRFAKGSGLRGLAGMKEETKRKTIRLLRPLLHVSKNELVSICQDNNIPYVTDPSNASDHYARGRLRRVKDALEEEGFSEERLLDFGARASDAAEAILAYAKDFLRFHALITYGGSIQLNRGAFEALPRATALEVLSLILQAMHPKPYPPKRAHLLEILEQTNTTSLQGCLIQRSQDHILILREPAAVTEKHVIRPHETILWDHRFHVTYEGEENNLEVSMLGIQPHTLLKEIAPDLLKKVPQGRVRATLPALWKGDRLIELPEFSCAFGALFK